MQDYNLGPSVSVEAVGDKYDQTSTYAVGDYCIKDDKLYVCNTAIETAEAWNASHWTDTTIADVLKTIPVVVDNLTTNDGTKALSAAQGKALNSKTPFPPYIAKGILGSTEDFNNITTSGTYQSNGTGSNANAPISGDDNGDLVVFGEHGRKLQLWVSAYNNKMLIRQQKNSTWSAWDELALSSKTIKETGKSLSASNVTSDTYVLGLGPGVYKLAGNKSDYLPTRYGILIKFNSGASYGTCVVFSTEGGHMYFRSFYDNAWHTNNWFSLTGTAV